VPAAVPILVVDDNDDAAETLSMALESLGCEVRVAYCAALELLSFFKPAVAILDAGLPDMNGYELARRLRLTAGCERITLIAITGWGQDTNRQRAFDAGFNHHMTKPIDFNILRQLLPGPVRIQRPPKICEQ
jgi:CheY-like chemotaxis protein